MRLVASEHFMKHPHEDGDGGILRPLVGDKRRKIEGHRHSLEVARKQEHGRLPPERKHESADQGTLQPRADKSEESAVMVLSSISSATSAVP